MAGLPLAFRLALRELRGGLSGFYVFIACIALGVAAIAGVNSVSRALTEGISAEGRTILGGDIAFELQHREASPEELAYFRSNGMVGVVADMHAMVRRADGESQALVELRGVDASYPHGGTLRLEDGTSDGQRLLELQDGAFGALAAPELLDRLGVEQGDSVRLGDETLVIRGVIRSEPDRLSSGLGFGPRFIVSVDALRASDLVRPGSLIEWIYRIRLPEGANDIRDIGQMRGEADRSFPEAGWSKRSRDNAAPSLRRNIERFSQFLTLVGLTALIVGGVGVANAVSSYVDLKRPAIATLKCLGARGATVFQIYLIQILLIACLGIGIGLVVGAMLPFAAGFALADLVPTSAIDIYPRELALAVVYGLLVTLGFVLGPLGRARELPAASLFADRAIHAPLKPPLQYQVARALALVALGAMAIQLGGDRELAFFYIGAVIAAFVVLRLVAIGIMAATRRIGVVRGTSLRLAVRNVHRPGALTPSVVLSLGLGLTLLVTLALIDTNLREQLSGAITEKAPDFFFIDVQNAERDDFVRLVTETAPGGVLETVPMLRGRIVEVDGVPSAQVQAQGRSSWALRGDRGITYSDTPPPNSTLAGGEWWPAGYDGEPLVSLEREIADDLGLRIGDTIAVNVLGRNVTARIANLRELEWESLSINFVLVFSPNTLAGAPHAHIATLRLAEDAGRDAERAVLSAVTAAFPGVTTIGVRDAIESVNAVIADLALGVRVAASLALVVSMLVLGGALAAGHRQRRQDAVILKTLGATRPVLLTAFSLEYGLLGIATALFAVAAGTAASWYVVTRIMELEFTVYPSVAATAAATALAVTLGLGLAGTWRILSVKPAPLLKNL
ncbi:MAG: ABC transporter permease [Propylenella sp.]